MIWLTWRQFRAQAIAAAGILAAALVYFVVTGLSMHGSYAADLSSCPGQNDCGLVLHQLAESYNAPSDLAQLLVIIAPALIGIFWGAPLIARELETGTHQLAWNQTVTRTRWLAVKFAGVGAVSILTAGVLSYLMTWWAAPLDQIGGGRFAAMTFSSRDIVPIAYAAFAFTLGSTLGLLMRRTIPAMAVTLAVFVGIQILIPTVVRPNLLSSTTVTFAIDEATMSRADGIFGTAGTFDIDGLPAPQGAWVLSSTPVENSAGQAVQMNDYSACFPGPSAAKPMFVFDQIGSCLASHDLHESITYQPESHYWPLQWIETALFGAAAAVLSGLCFWRIRRRQN